MTTVAPVRPAPVREPLNAAQERQFKEKMSHALSNLVLKQPFFASLVLQREITYTYDVPTAGADARGRIYINPAFAMSADVGTVEKIMFLLAHEVMHIAFLHCLATTVGNRNKRACNVAMDKVINETLIVEKCGTFIEGGQRHPGAETKAWEDLYVEPEDGGGDDPGDGPDVGGIGDDLVPCPDGEPVGDEVKQIAADIRQEVAAAAQAAKTQGKLSAGLSRLVEEIVYVKTPWHVYLERFMASFVASDYSWKRPNRRLMAHGYVLPGLDRVPRMGKIGIIGDTSGSIGGPIVNAFQAHVNRIIETCMPEEVIFLSVDTQVCNVQRFTPDEYPIKWEAKGFGGTDMRAGWQWFDENAPDVDCVICLTDGLTPWPDAVRIPSMVLTTDEPAPEHVGETVKWEE